MVGKYAIIKNPAIHSVDEKIPTFIVSKIIKVFNIPKEMNITGKVTYINKDFIK